MKRVSIYDLAVVLLRAAGPLNHVEIARELGISTNRVCQCLAYMERTRRVHCLDRPQRGPGALPGVWTLTRSGKSFAQFCAAGMVASR